MKLTGAVLDKVTQLAIRPSSSLVPSTITPLSVSLDCISCHDASTSDSSYCLRTFIALITSTSLLVSGFGRGTSKPPKPNSRFLV